ncbi:MAG: hypothetical protein NCW75_11065 [Phycisphaera sp.]|nr:MAG: hypothetical protein NCW75_11065 [Phycisphaera sp.]
MATNMPQERGAALDWVEQHIEPWTDNQAAIDLSVAQVAAITQLATTAREKLTAAGAARQAAKNATQEWYAAADQMKQLSSDLIIDIKAYARGDGGEQVYTLAQINPKDPPGEAPPPAVPSDMRTSLTNEGFVAMTWKGKGPTGTRYHVRRRLPSESAFAFLGDTSDKNFTDETVPQGTTRVDYQIVAVHTDKSVPGEPFFVQFGAGNNDSEPGQQDGGQPLDSKAA